MWAAGSTAHLVLQDGAADEDDDALPLVLVLPVLQSQLCNLQAHRQWCPEAAWFRQQEEQFPAMVRAAAHFAGNATSVLPAMSPAAPAALWSAHTALCCHRTRTCTAVARFTSPSIFSSCIAFSTLPRSGVGVTSTWRMGGRALAREGHELQCQPHQMPLHSPLGSSSVPVQVRVGSGALKRQHGMVVRPPCNPRVLRQRQQTAWQQQPKLLLTSAPAASCPPSSSPPPCSRGGAAFWRPPAGLRHPPAARHGTNHDEQQTVSRWAKVLECN